MDVTRWRNQFVVNNRASAKSIGWSLQQPKGQNENKISKVMTYVRSSLGSFPIPHFPFISLQPPPTSQLSLFICLCFWLLDLSMAISGSDPIGLFFFRNFLIQNG